MYIYSICARTHTNTYVFNSNGLKVKYWSTDHWRKSTVLQPIHLLQVLFPPLEPPGFSVYPSLAFSPRLFMAAINSSPSCHWGPGNSFFAGKTYWSSSCSACGYLLTQKDTLLVPCLVLSFLFLPVFTESSIHNLIISKMRGLLAEPLNMTAFIASHCTKCLKIRLNGPLIFYIRCCVPVKKIWVKQMKIMLFCIFNGSV